MTEQTADVLITAPELAGLPGVTVVEPGERLEAPSNLTLLDVRWRLGGPPGRELYDAGHIPGARLLPRGQLELRVNQDLPDPTRRILACCELGYISTLAAATLRSMGFMRAVALDGGMKAWREVGYPLKTGKEP